MKTNLFTISFCLLVTLFWSCDEIKPKQESGSLVESIEGLNFAETENYYVLAQNGLRMREDADLSSDKVAILKYRSKVQVIPTDVHDIDPVNGLSGSMVKGIQGRHKGYIFNAYLSTIPVPKDGQRAEAYVSYLQDEKYNANYSSIETEGEALELEEIITLPARNIQEAFLLGQRFDIYNFDFDLPLSNSKVLNYRDSQGKAKTLALFEGRPEFDMSFMLEEYDSNYWFRELNFKFDGREISSINVDAGYEGGSWSCSLEKEGEFYVFRKLSIAD